VTQTDEYLKQAVCTFHNILKNCLLQTINQDVILLQQDQRVGDSYNITHQLCYFKNFNFQNKRQMKIKKVEQSIKQRMQMLRKEQRQFLKNQYPELVRDLATRPLDLEVDFEPAKNLGDSPNNLGKTQCAPENNIFEFDALFQNAFHIKTQHMKIPNLAKQSNGDRQIRDQNFAKKVLDFYMKLQQLFEDFSDFKKVSDKINDFDLYFKLIAKEIIFIIKVPSTDFFEKQLKLTKATNSLTHIQVDYYLIKKQMITLAKWLRQSRIYRRFTSQYDILSLIGKHQPR
jgi:hypothetical protein